MNTFTQEQKKEVERQIVDTCIGALDNKALTEEQMGDVSFFVLERIDLIKTQAELLEFLDKLSEKWHIFKPLLDITRGKAEVVVEQKTAHDAEALVKDGNIDQAIDLMHEAKGKEEVV